jgi:hypothetical protein
MAGMQAPVVNGPQMLLWNLSRVQGPGMGMDDVIQQVLIALRRRSYPAIKRRTSRYFWASTTTFYGLIATTVMDMSDLVLWTQYIPRTCIA